MLVLSSLNLRRLAPGLGPWVARGWDFVPVPLEQPVGDLLRIIGARNPDGILIEFEPELLESVFAFRKPTVVLFADLLVEGAACVNADDYAMGRLAAEHFLERRFRSHAFCGRPFLHAPGRQTGFRDALREAGHSHLLFEATDAAGGDSSWQAPDDRLLAWLESLPGPCGIFAAHDSLGRMVAEGARRIGRRIPDDLAILSASDDSLVCELADPPLSRIEVPWAEIAAAAAGGLDRLARGETAPEDPLLIPPSGVVTRISTETVAVDNPLVERALRYARDHLGSLGNVDEWVRVIGTNRRHMERLFRTVLHESPHEALIRLRVLRAREEILHSDRSLAVIAESCGFSRPEKLSFHFRRVTGQPPSALRRRER